MEQAYHFDFVHDTQAVFRQLLTAIAHPMSLRSIATQAEGFAWEQRSLWAVACTLLDNETGFYVEKDAELARKLADLTLARHELPGEADYIVLSAPLNYDSIRVLFQGAKKGTLADPQNSATFLIYCTDFEGDEPLTFTGPGINGSRKISTTPYISNICALREELEWEYPCGIDLFFIDEKGGLMALPRLCRTSKA